MATVLQFTAEKLHPTMNTEQDSAGKNTAIGGIVLLNETENKTANFMFRDDQPENIEFDKNNPNTVTVTRPFKDHSSFLMQVNTIKQTNLVIVTLSEEDGGLLINIGSNKNISLP